MKILDFIEKIQDETSGVGGMYDSYPVMVKLKDGTYLQVASVELTPEGLIIKTQNW